MAGNFYNKVCFLVLWITSWQKQETQDDIFILGQCYQFKILTLIYDWKTLLWFLNQQDMDAICVDCSMLGCSTPLKYSIISNTYSLFDRKERDEVGMENCDQNIKWKRSSQKGRMRKMGECKHSKDEVCEHV